MENAMSTNRKQTKARDPSAAPAAGMQDRGQLVALAAYFKAEARGFEPGHELEDWLAAERELAAGNLSHVRH